MSLNKGNTPSVYEISIRLAAFSILIIWCFLIIKPFIQIVLWGVILAIAARPIYLFFMRMTSSKRKLSVFLFIATFLVFLSLPIFWLGESMFHGSVNLKEWVDKEEVELITLAKEARKIPYFGEKYIPSNPQDVSEWERKLAKVMPTLRTIAKGLIKGIASFGLELVFFVISVLLAGVLLYYEYSGKRGADLLFEKIAGDHGRDLSKIIAQTIQNVVRGILGVAAIQSIAAGVGFLLIGLPGAGLWAIVCLLLAVMQIGLLPVSILSIIYAWSNLDVFPAILFTVWMLALGLTDNVLKPLLMGRDAPVPTLVIFLGSLGGFISFGIIGLFTGAVVLSIGYRIYTAWVKLESTAAETAQNSESS